MRVNERLVSVYVSKNDKGYRICDITKDLIPLYNKYLSIIVGPFGAITDNELSTLKSWQFRKIKLAKAYITWYSKNLEETYNELKKEKKENE